MIKGYCNNLDLIQQVTKMQNCKTPNPSWTIKNDYDWHNSNNSAYPFSNRTSPHEMTQGQYKSS